MACPSPTAPWAPPPSSPTGNLPAPTSYMTTYNPATLSWCLLATSATLPSTFPAFLLIDTWRGVSTRGRYIADRFLPDKAIDLVDEAAAKLRIDATSRPQVLDEVSRKLLHHLAAPLSPQQKLLHRLTAPLSPRLIEWRPRTFVWAVDGTVNVQTERSDPIPPPLVARGR